VEDDETGGPGRSNIYLEVRRVPSKARLWLTLKGPSGGGELKGNYRWRVRDSAEIWALGNKYISVGRGKRLRSCLGKQMGVRRGGRKKRR